MIEKLLKKLSVKILNSDEVGNIIGNSKEYQTKLIQDLSLETALRFYKEEITYLEGDFIMNNLYHFWNHRFSDKYGFSEIAWECYEAFDAGEYSRSKDDLELDPIDIYTKPLIEGVLKKMNKI